MAWHTDRVYTILGTELLPRRANLQIDSDLHKPVEEEVPGIIHVSHGLLPGDLAVYLSHIDESERIPSLGYLVSEVERGSYGAGWLIDKEMACSNPKLWVNNRIYTAVRHLSPHGHQVLGELGLSSIDAYISDSVPPSDASQ